MTSKKVEVKKKKSKKTIIKKPTARMELRLPLESSAILREALICAVDDPKRWGQPGTVAERYKGNSKAMNVIAEKAADLCRGDRCFFCDVQQDPTPTEDVYRFNPDVPLCACHTPHRRMAFDYVENWDTVEGKKSLLRQAEEGKLSLDTPIYQYFCRCRRKDPVVIDLRTITAGLKKYQKHSRRRLCNDCYKAEDARRKHLSSLNRAPELTAARPNKGPSAKINKVKHKKNKGPEEKSLPPLNTVLPEPAPIESNTRVLEQAS